MALLAVTLGFRVIHLDGLLRRANQRFDEAMAINRKIEANFDQMHRMALDWRREYFDMAEIALQIADRSGEAKNISPQTREWIKNARNQPMFQTVEQQK